MTLCISTSMESQIEESVEHMKSSTYDEWLFGLMKNLINNEKIYEDYFDSTTKKFINKEIILSQDERLDYLYTINEYNYYHKHKIVRSGQIKERLRSYADAMKDTSMADSTHCLAAFLSPRLTKLLD